MEEEEYELIRNIPKDVPTTPLYLGAAKQYLQEEVSEHLDEVYEKSGLKYEAYDLQYTFNSKNRTIKVRYKAKKI